MAEIEVFSIISPHDYAAFRTLTGDDIPATFDEWSKLQAKEIRQFVQVGSKTGTVPVDPNEFTRFLHARGAIGNRVSPRDFAIEKFYGKRY